MEHNKNFKKPRKIRMNVVECQRMADSEEGAKALTQPQTVARSSRDVNRGLYPRDPFTGPRLPVNHQETSHIPPAITDPSLSGSFVKASCLVQPVQPFSSTSPVKSEPIAEPSEEGTNNVKRRGRGKQRSPQKNTLDNYFSPLQRKTVDTCSDFDRDASSTGIKSEPSTSTPLPSTSSHIKSEPSVSCHIKSEPSASIDVKSEPSTSTYVKSEPTTCIKHEPSTSTCIKRESSTFTCIKNESSPSADDKDFGFDDIVPRKKQKTEGTTSNADKSAQKTEASTYGLLGDAECILLDSDSDFEDCDVGKDLTLNVPDEVLEVIFCQLPLVDLCLQVGAVCQRWHDIVHRTEFCLWKKRYNRLIRGHDDAKNQMTTLMMKNNMTSQSDYLPQLFRSMVDFKPVTARNVLHYLEQHPKYSIAQFIITNRLPECLSNQKPHPWTCVAVLVLLSDDVTLMSGILSCLLSSQCSLTAVMECLYRIAAFLWMFKSSKYGEIWNGMHYRLTYALYLFENESFSTCGQLQNAVSGATGQQSLTRYASADSAVRMTHEQMLICNHKLGSADTIKIVAFAGTGKTTTLVRYTQLRPRLKFLLVVFNKSVEQQAKQRFPRNVDCRTCHSLAFAKVGRRYMARKKPLLSLRVGNLVEILPSRKGLSLYVRAKFVLDTVNTYLASADENITTAHVPDSQVLENGDKKVIDHEIKMGLADDAEFVWNKMRDDRDKSVAISHDGYLKIYQLSKPKLDSKYDVLLIDEAQDLTPAVADILLSQPQPKILVGDPHQQIYAFRGAVNAMRLITPTKVFYLTQSFRFGPEIARVANICLEFLKGENRKTLIGSAQPGHIDGRTVGQIAVICRTNFTVFAEAVKKCCFTNDTDKVGFVGGLNNFGLDVIMDIYILQQPLTNEEKKLQIDNNFIRGFVNRGFAELKSYAERTCDHELQGKIKIVQTYHSALPGHIDKIRRKCVTDCDLADVVFSTAHKAKGLEFSTVKVTDDFNVDRVSQDESNLLYVAATRAKRCLVLSQSLLRILKIAGEDFTSFELRENESGSNIKKIIKVKKPITRSDGMTFSGGVDAAAAGGQPMPGVQQLQ